MILMLQLRRAGCSGSLPRLPLGARGVLHRVPSGFTLLPAPDWSHAEPQAEVEGPSFSPRLSRGPRETRLGLTLGCPNSGLQPHLLMTWLLRCRLNSKLQRLMVLSKACLKGRQSHCSQPWKTLVFSHLDTSSYSFS